MPNIEVSINGRLYAVACDPGQENHLRTLAGMVDSRVRQLSGGNPRGTVGESHMLVLAGLMLADELSEAEAAAVPNADGTQAGAAEDEELLVAAVEHLTDRIAVIADRLQRA